MTLIAFLTSVALCQTSVPDHEVPPSVQAELNALQGRFEIALAEDCDEERCTPKRCVYVDHAVADRPRARSLPGLSQDPGPGSVEAQEYLTRAQCGFAVESSVAASDVATLSRRLRAKISTGWTVVEISHERLEPLPDYLREPPEPEPEEEPEPEPEPTAEPDWTRELWNTLLPHFFWMIAIALTTLAATVLIWASRRVGTASIEDQMLLAELAAGTPPPPDADAPEPAVAEPGPDEVAEAHEAWSARLAAMDPDTPNPEITALVRELLLAEELDLLAKAVLTFPDTLPAAFPSGGDVAASKLALAEYLKTVDKDSLPDDASFYTRLSRHALAATVSTQQDARVVRSLREDFGAAGLGRLIGNLAPRPAALVFALAPREIQQEAVRLLVPQQRAEISDMLLWSNRIDPEETDHLFDVLNAIKAGEQLPDPPKTSHVSDRGSLFDAPAALSVLLESLNQKVRDALFGTSLRRFQGSLPTWHREILVSDMLHALTDERRADLFLGIDASEVAAWMSLLPKEKAEALLQGAPGALRNALRASPSAASTSQRMARADQGRRAISAALVRALAGAGVPFEDVVRSGETSE